MKKELINSKSALVAVIGRPNVGKSTLVNYLLGRKLSITSKRPQTTRRRVMGVGNFDNNLQLAFFDTPGIHTGYNRVINTVMNKQAGQSPDFADIILWLIEAGRPKKDDLYITKFLNNSRPTILVLNKVDKLHSTSELLPIITDIDSQLEHLHLAAIVPLSATSGKNTDQLIKLLRQHAPEQEPMFSSDFDSDQPEGFFLAELVREKVIRLCGMEVPHQLGVHIENIKEEEKYIRIDAIISVEQSGQKSIVIGTKGSKLKKAGTQARLEMEKWLGKKVMLSLWVKVKPNWSNNYQSIHQLGYTSNSK